MARFLGAGSDGLLHASPIKPLSTRLIFRSKVKIFPVLNTERSQRAGL